MVKKNRDSHLFPEILFAALLLALLVLTLASEISRFSEMVSFETVELATYTHTDTLCGYVFRDESAPGTLNNGPIDYLAADGTAVQKGDVLAQVFRDDTGTDKRERAAALYAQIAEYEAALSNADTWGNDYYDAYTLLMQGLTQKGGTASVKDAAALSAVIGGKDAAKSQLADEMQQKIEALKKELQELTVHTNDPHTVSAEIDGVFYHEADGYEALFGTDAAATLSPTTLSELLQVAPAVTETVGKLVSCGTWYLAVPTSKSLADTYRVGDTYTVHFAQGSAQMLLARIATDETPDAAILMFSAAQKPTWLGAARRQSVTVEKESVSGLCIPACAVVNGDSVFVLRDGKAWLCPITPLLKENGCLLLSAEGKEGSLQKGDVVILCERQLFHGKVLE